MTARLWLERLRRVAPPRVIASGAPALWQAGPGRPIEISLLAPSGNTVYRLELPVRDVEALCRLVRPRRP